MCAGEIKPAYPTIGYLNISSHGTLLREANYSTTPSELYSSLCMGSSVSGQYPSTGMSHPVFLKF